MALSTTLGKIYLVSIDNPEQIVELQFVPDKLEIERNMDMQHIQYIGQNYSHYHYLAGAKEIEFDIDLFADYDARLQVIDKILILEAWTMNEGFNKQPTRLSLVWGEMTQYLATENIWVLKPFKPIFSQFDSNDGGLPRSAKFKITLCYEPSKNIKASDILKQVTDLRFQHGR